MLAKQKKNYLYGLIATFAVGLIISILLAGDSALVTTYQYFVILIYILSILSFVYFLVKMLFHSQAENSRQELKLEDLPKDQDEVSKNK